MVDDGVLRVDAYDLKVLKACLRGNQRILYGRANQRLFNSLQKLEDMGLLQFLPVLTEEGRERVELEELIDCGLIPNLKRKRTRIGHKK